MNKWKAAEIAFEQQAKIFNISKDFPKEEYYSLTNQIRRSSRAVCANIAEAYCKKRYIPHLVSKLTDADAENEETKVWFEIAAQCRYLKEEELNSLNQLNLQIGKLLYYMMKNPEKFSYR